MKKNEQYNEKLMFEIAQENKRLNDPLQKVCLRCPSSAFPCARKRRVVPALAAATTEKPFAQGRFGGRNTLCFAKFGAKPKSTQI